MVKHVTDEFENYTFAQMQVLVDRDELSDNRQAEAEKELPAIDNGDGSINEAALQVFCQSEKRYQENMAEITRRALECGLSAIAPAVINVGNHLIHFKTWLGRSYIAFTEQDKRALCESKTAILSRLITALKDQNRILYCNPHRVIVGDKQITYLAPSTRAQFVDRCMAALWIDLDAHTDKYLSNAELDACNGLLNPLKFKDEPAPQDDASAVGRAKVGLYFLRER